MIPGASHAWAASSLHLLVAVFSASMAGQAVSRRKTGRSRYSVDHAGPDARGLPFDSRASGRPHADAGSTRPARHAVPAGVQHRPVLHSRAARPDDRPLPTDQRRGRISAQEDYRAYHAAPYFAMPGTLRRWSAARCTSQSGRRNLVIRARFAVRPTSRTTITPPT